MIKNGFELDNSKKLLDSIKSIMISLENKFIKSGYNKEEIKRCLESYQGFYDQLQDEIEEYEKTILLNVRN